jgi:hypothetical protein
VEEVSVEEAISDLERQRASTAESLVVATKALKKCRQKSGAAAYKRGWHYEEQIKKAEERLVDLDGRLAKLREQG